MKNIFIGDIHGRPVWKEIVTKHEDAENIVFIGDYFDSFDIGPLLQLGNVNDIVRYKREREKDPTKKVYLLIGNHDIHYWPGNKSGGSTSGYQVKMRSQFEQFFKENKDMFQMSIIIGNRLCSHAGVSDEFLKDTGYYKQENTPIDDYLNELFKYKPNEFLFNSYENRVNTGQYVDGYGDNTWQTPIWIRPRSLQKVNKNTDLKKDYIQIVGHTQKEHIDIKGKTTGKKYYYIDTLASGEYLIDNDGEFEIGYCTIEKYI